MPSEPSPERSRGAAVCPGCGKPALLEHMPFCSQGCRDRDLLQWLSDGYRLPGPPAEEGMTDFDADALDR
jgi:uncharacterized protein